MKSTTMEPRKTGSESGQERRLEACSTQLRTLGWTGCTMLAVAILALVGCRVEESSTAARSARDSRPVVVSANYPLHYFAQQIGGDSIETMFLVPADIDPAYWEPSPKDIARMQPADLILLNGATYEKWLSKVSLPQSKLVDTSAGFSEQFIHEEGDVTHQHGPGGEHTHGDVAFTTWLDLSLAIQQAQAVERALASLLPDQAAHFSNNLAKLTNDLAALDREFLAWGESAKAQPLIASHPVYQYFARRYGLNLKSVHWEPDEAPDEAAWQEYEELLKTHPTKWMIWESEPLDEVATRLMSLGVHSVVVSPCGNTSEAVDFVSAMRENLSRLQMMQR